MRIELRGVSKGRRGQSLQTTSIGFESGRATLARVETEQRPTVLGLIAHDTGQPVERIFEDSLHDRWYTAEQARDYGIVDAVITARDMPSNVLAQAARQTGD